MKGYKVELKYDFAETLVGFINKALEQVRPADDDDRIFLAGLAEVKQRLYVKMGNHRSQYTITFTPVQALSLRILYTDVITNPTTDYAANTLRQIADEIHRHYS